MSGIVLQSLEVLLGTTSMSAIVLTVELSSYQDRAGEPDPLHW